MESGATKTSLKKSKTKVKATKEPEEENDLEAAYLREQESKKPVKVDQTIEEASEAEEDADDSNSDPSRLVHESLTDKSKSKSTRGSKQKYVPPDETAVQRDQRTIFIGNLSLEVAQKRVRIPPS